MKRFLAIALAATFALAAGNAYASLGGTIGKPVNSVSAYAVSDAANGIAFSRHNLGSMGNFLHSDGTISGNNLNTDVGGPVGGPGGTSEICVFCHTPHHSENMLIGDPDVYIPVSGYPLNAPLWNRQSKAPKASFKGYGTTIGGTVIADNDIGGLTLACLSCHDGVTTFDVLANGPGAGGIGVPYYTAQKVWNFSAGNSGNSSYNRFTDELGGVGLGQTTLGQEARLNIGNTGGDLSNDHPLSVVYSDGTNSTTKKASLRDRTTTISSIDLRTGLALSTTNSAELNANLSQNKWAIVGFISDTATISDLLRNSKVECVSCHDPHFKNLSNIDLNNTALSSYGIVAWSDGLFLRRVGGNAGSGVCRTCHNK